MLFYLSFAFFKSFRFYLIACFIVLLMFQINGLEIGVDIMCDEVKRLLTDENPSVKLELARPKKHVSP